MTKVIIRETIIALLVCLAVLLILSVALYNYIPTNKVIPETVEYAPTKEIQTQLNSAVEDNSNEILMTYEITAQDLDNYERTNEYNPGKANPFAAASEQPADTGNGSENSNGENGNTVTPVQPSNGNSGGSLFENKTSK
jgi:hypothetical protein